MKEWLRRFHTYKQKRTCIGGDTESFISQRYGKTGRDSALTNYS
jgi:hypothetical protein